MSRVVGYSLIVGLLIAFAGVGCDYGVADGEDPGALGADYSELEGSLSASASEFTAIMPNREMFLGLMKSPFFGLGPELRDAEQDKKDQGEPSDVGCDVCAEQCAACMDGYICGHEAMILENCNACAKCQAGCNGALDPGE